jgi:RNA polymerase sigma-70 factor (ECF subfamily)
VSGTGDDSLLIRWRQGDQQAAAELFGRYARRLTALARSRLSNRLAQRLDAEDVVQSVYRSFFAGARQGRYELQRGGDLWRVLVAITLHKLYHQVQVHSTDKRAIDRQQNFGSEDSLLGLQAEVLARGPSPVEAAALADELEQVFGRLKPVHRRMLELRLQGYTIEEIAATTQRSEQRVYRILQRIKQELRQKDK